MNDKELKELQDIKKLLVLQLLASGIRAGDIADVLGMDKVNSVEHFRLESYQKHQNKLWREAC